jgi:membrane protein
VLKAFGVHNQLQPVLLSPFKPLGEQGVELAARVIGYVENINFGVLGAAGLVFLLYSVIELLTIIEECFNRIWRVSCPRSWLRRCSDYLSVLLVGPVLVVSALGVMASMRDMSFVQKILALEPFGSVYYLAVLFLPYLLLIAALAFIYKFMPNTRINSGSALIGGVAAGLAWKMVGWLFGIFVVKSVSYNAIYSSFAIILLSMIWLYVSWLIVLLGGVISFLHQHPRYLLYKNQKPELSHRQQEYLGLLIMYLIGKAHYEGKVPWTLYALADASELPWEAVRKMLQILEREKLVIPVQSEPNGFLPARAPETISLKEIYIALRSFDKELTVTNPKMAENVMKTVIQLEEAALGALSERTLSDFIHRNPV